MGQRSLESKVVIRDVTCHEPRKVISLRSLRGILNAQQTTQTEQSVETEPRHNVKASRMSKTTLQTIGLLIGLAVIVAAAPLLWKIGEIDQSRAGLKLGETIPPITDVEGWLNGDAPTSEDLQGKVVFVNGWFLNCPYCHEGMPDLVKLYDEYHSKGVVFVGMTSDDSEIVKNVEQFLSKYKVEWPNAYGAANALIKFKAEYFPGYWLIGRDGKVVWNKALQGRVPIGAAIEKALAAKASAAGTPTADQPDSSASPTADEQPATAQL